MIEFVIHQLPLPLLERIGTNWNFRCVICGDSKKSETKKRGWILVDGTKVTYHCHNCGYSVPIFQFLKENFPDVYKDYVKILFKSKRQSHEEKLVQTTVERDVSSNQQSKLDLPTLNALPKDHFAVKYYMGRQLPIKFLKYLHFTKNYCEFVNTLLPGKFDNPPDEDPRIVIPFYSVHRKIFAIQGRSFQDYGLRYMTIKFNDHKKIFGLERMNANKTILVLEGAFDSFFLPNSIAFGGADLDLDYLLELAPRDRFVFCFDNEPRNPQMCKRIEKILKQGFRVCLMPAKYKRYGKDINQMVEKGMTPRDICVIIKDNIVQGKFGLMKFKLWKKGK
jgi:transcription elongation factor Elf1